MRRSLADVFAVLGPGLAVAATGVGAGDVVAAAVSGAEYGVAILWAAVIGAALKFSLNEGIARWQLATETTLLQGWGRHLHRVVLAVFLVYLVVWTLLIAAALMSACGLAVHAIFPAVPIDLGGVVHSLVALILVFFGRYALFERLMKIFVGLMFVTVVASAVLVRPDVGAMLQGLLLPTVPAGSGKFLLGVIGGVGGSVTLLSYSYWMRERGWKTRTYRREVRIDLAAAYVLTGIFGVALIVVAAGTDSSVMQGSTMALEIADQVGEMVGPYGMWIFLVGFWGAVFTSMLGVWQGVPYIFADTVNVLRFGRLARRTAGTESPWYRGYLLFIGLPPMALLLFDEPVWIVIVYSIVGAFFMPFLAATLLALNNQKKMVGDLRNGLIANGLLVAALALFAYLFVSELMAAL